MTDNGTACKSKTFAQTIATRGLKHKRKAGRTRSNTPARLHRTNRL
jgi:hypothetical protein